MGSPDEWTRFVSYAASHWPHVLLVFTLVIIYLLVEDPNRGDKLRAIILEPIFRLFKLFPRQYLAARIGSSTTIFLRKHIAKYIASIGNFRIRIKWVRTAKDPIFKQNGTVLLHIPETNDQTLNVMRATQAALPVIVCKSLRGNIDANYCRAIDLTILKNLARELGPHAYPIYQKHFLAPEVAEDLELQQLLSELIEIDDHGIFTTIFLNELESVGIDVFNAASTANLTNAVHGFLEFLLHFPRRSVGDHTRLTYNAPHFRVAVILVAISARAYYEGVTPYVKRVHKNLSAGVDSIYLYAFRRSASFLKKLANTLKEDERLLVADVQSVRVKKLEYFGGQKTASITLLSRNPLFFDYDFQARINANDLAENSRVQGRVIDVSQSTCLVEVCGILGSLPRSLCSWNNVYDCGELVAIGDIREFVVHEIDCDKGLLILSAQLPEEDPWSKNEILDIGDTVEVIATTMLGGEYICHTSGGVEIRISKNEMSWLPWECSPEHIIGNKFDCRVLEKDEDTHTITGSVRVLQEDPWPGLQEALRPGTRLSATVTVIADESILVTTSNDLQGFILATAFEDAGFGYQEYRKSLVVGSELQVTVEKVFRSRQKIRFSIARTKVRTGY